MAIYYLPPAKLNPPMPLARTILTPIAMCSHVPMLSPVHMAPWRWEPAKNERVSTNGRLAGLERALSAWAVMLCCN